MSMAEMIPGLSELLRPGRWIERGGLAVPSHWVQGTNSAQANPPLSILRQAVTYADLFGAPLPLDEILERIRQVPRSMWLKFVAAMSLAYDRDGFLNPALDQQLTLTLAPPDLQPALQEKLGAGQRCLGYPQALAALAKLAISYAPATGEMLPEEVLNFVFLTYLAVGDQIDRASLSIPQADQRAALLRYFVRNTDFAVHPVWGETFARL